MVFFKSMKIVDSATMRRLDEVAIKKYGIPGCVLMENAGRGVAEVIEKDLEKFGYQKLIIK